VVGWQVTLLCKTQGKLDGHAAKIPGNRTGFYNGGYSMKALGFRRHKRRKATPDSSGSWKRVTGLPFVFMGAVDIATPLTEVSGWLSLFGPLWSGLALSRTI